MSFDVFTIPQFDKEAKRLAKKFPSFTNDLTDLITDLSNDPFQGTSLGNNCYKIRFAIKSKGKGKSGGARVITHIVVFHKQVFLLTIFDKSEKENLAEGELKQLLSEIEK